MVEPMLAQYVVWQLALLALTETKPWQQYRQASVPSAPAAVGPESWVDWLALIALAVAVAFAAAAVAAAKVVFVALAVGLTVAVAEQQFVAQVTEGYHYRLYLTEQAVGPHH